MDWLATAGRLDLCLAEFGLCASKREMECITEDDLLLLLQSWR